MTPSEQERKGPYTLQQLRSLVEGVTDRKPKRGDQFGTEIMHFGDTVISGGAGKDTYLLLAVTPASSDYLVTALDFFIAGTGGAGGITVTLPTAVGITGMVYCIKKIDAGAGAVSVAPNGGETIDGAAPHALNAQYDKVAIISDGANWLII